MPGFTEPHSMPTTADRSVVMGNIVVDAGSIRILHGINFKLYPGELCALLGPSGAGKSTLIKVLLGIRKPDKGKVTIGDQAVRDSGPVGYVPQDDALHRDLKVIDELKYAGALRLPGLKKEDRQVIIQRVLSQVGLTERQFVRIKKLSGGQRKRVSVALELLTNPGLLVLDEPTSGLDPGLEATMMQLFSRISAQGQIVLVATHTMESLDFCQTLLLLMQGRLVFAGRPADACKYFKVQEYATIFKRLPARSPDEWQSAFMNHSLRRTFEARPRPQINRSLKSISASTGKVTLPPSKKKSFNKASVDNQAESAAFNPEDALAALKRKIAEREKEQNSDNP